MKTHEQYYKNTSLRHQIPDSSFEYAGRDLFYRLDMDRPVEACIAEARTRWRGQFAAASALLPFPEAMEA